MEDAQFENWRPNRPLRLVDGFCVIRRGAEASRDGAGSELKVERSDLEAGAAGAEEAAGAAGAAARAAAAAASSRPGHRRNESSAVAAFLNARVFEPRATDWFLWKTEKEVRKMRAGTANGGSSDDLPVSDRIHISDPSTSKNAVIPERLLQICPFVFPDKISIARDPGEPSLHSFALTDGSGAQSCELRERFGLDCDGRSSLIAHRLLLISHISRLVSSSFRRNGAHLPRATDADRGPGALSAGWLRRQDVAHGVFIPRRALYPQPLPFLAMLSRLSPAALPRCFWPRRRGR